MADDAAIPREIDWERARTSLGDILVAASAKGVCWLSFGQDAGTLQRHFAAARLTEHGDRVKALLGRVVKAIEEPSSAMTDIPLDVAGTPFQCRVWEALRAIPCGETRSYRQIAAMLGNGGASRAVGAANAANKVAVLIPCHRVVAASGALGGYAWGLGVKAELLRREQCAGGVSPGLLL
jgi:AraC family transcriptional regulator, regulatory protein of adaptative response / methylated-DNA-[protein]-cysteine methyltransferase